MAHQIFPEIQEKSNVPKFSLGLSFYDIMELSTADLKRFLTYVSRDEILSWLQWNDRNGVYMDIPSLREFGSVLTKEEGIEIIVRQLS